MKTQLSSVNNKSSKEVSRIRLVIGIGFIILSVTNFIKPNPNAVSARWAWLHEIIMTSFGSYGWPILQALVGLIFVVWSMKKID